MENLRLRAETLVEALPYIRQYHGRTVVVKFGGHAMTSEELSRQVMSDIVLMNTVGMRPVVVHGGGPQVSSMMSRLGVEARFVDGLRVTDDETLEVAEMVLAGTINKGIVGQIHEHGGRAVGLSGRDAGVIVAEPAANGELGHVGEVREIRPGLLENLLDGGFVPVLCSISEGPHGKALNVNADVAAGHVARALSPASLIVLTDVPGVLADPEDPDSRISQLTVSQARDMLQSGAAGKGMIPKLEACLEALHGQGNRVHIIDGRIPHAVIMELLTDEGIGTLVVPD
ncbi:MAG: acetylglutamate kinase [Armatimonadia bacterium]|nr:acetylglutamate kinase [Armatimonadia bacterium]